MQNEERREIPIMKRKIAASVILLAIVMTAALIGSAQQQQLEPQDDTGLPAPLWKRGLAIAPVQLNLAGRNQKQVGLGSYIVNAMSGCADCHTNPLFLPTGDPFQGQPPQVNVAGYLAGGTAFGPFISRNLTPEPPSNMPAGLTLDQFIEVLRTGKDFDNAHPQFGPLLQVMPWPIFKNMTDDDLTNIYEYLSSIPHADTPQ
jgi:mono/diheme cytochrome c family protein